MEEISINIQGDLDAINNQIATLTEEAKKIDNAKVNVEAQLIQMQGIAAYLRGKLPDETVALEEETDLERTTEIPED